MKSVNVDVLIARLLQRLESLDTERAEIVSGLARLRRTPPSVRRTGATTALRLALREGPLCSADAARIGGKHGRTTLDMLRRRGEVVFSHYGASPLNNRSVQFWALASRATE